MTGELSIRSANEVAIEFQPHACSWMVVGIMSASFSFAVESLDFNRGEMGGYWQASVARTGNGSGSGYALLRFPRRVPEQGAGLALPQP